VSGINCRPCLTGVVAYELIYGRAVQVDPGLTRFECAWFQLRKLTCDELLQGFAFNRPFSVYRLGAMPLQRCGQASALGAGSKIPKSAYFALRRYMAVSVIFPAACHLKLFEAELDHAEKALHWRGMRSSPHCLLIVYLFTTDNRCRRRRRRHGRFASVQGLTRESRSRTLEVL